MPVAPSAVPITGEGMLAMTSDGKMVPYETPRALETEEVGQVVEAFRQAAVNAKAAGFDGVEIHGANGYLLEQFLQSRTNLRTDQYGGSIENRARLLLEIAQAVIAVWGSNRVGVRLSPYGVANGSGEADPMPLYSHVIRTLDPLGLAYLHFIEPRSSGAGRAEVNHQNVPSAMLLFRPLWRGKLITAAGVSSGIDMALVLAAELAGPEVARAIQLAIEYDPQPPFDSGHMSKASAKTKALATAGVAREVKIPAALKAGTQLLWDRALAKARR